MSGFFKILAGAAEIAAGAAVDLFTGGTAGNWLIGIGVGTTLAGIGAAIAGNPIKGMATAVRNPIAPWKVCFGRVRTGGTMLYMHTWGADDQMLDMVVAIAAHPCQSFDELLFDQQRVQIDTTAIPTSAKAGYTIPAPAVGSGTSFTPVQQTINIFHIQRVDNVVKVTLHNNIPYLSSGDQVQVLNVTGDNTLNGIVQVSEIISRTTSGAGTIVFTYLSGGSPSAVDNQGQVKTRWPDYGRDIYVEPLLGAQTLGQTFVGMTAGTPWQGTGELVTPASVHSAGGPAYPNPWTSYCSAPGQTLVFIRLKYSSHFTSGLPQISFLFKGKNNIYDPRSGGSYGYSENAALCVADYLSNATWGYKAAYGTDIDNTDLAAEANHCDEAITLAIGGTEPRYACNGQFDLSMHRGEVLKNLLSSCAGRISYVGGKYRVHPGVWLGASPASVDLMAIATAPFKWRPKSSIRDLFNAVKGTYISPENKWQSTDFPRYAQDVLHGYSSDANLAADGERRTMELHLPFTISAATAQRIAKIMMLRSRYSGTGTFPMNMGGYQFVPPDVISASVSYLGFSGKLLEVQTSRFTAAESNGAVALGTEIDVQETDSAIYAWATTEELSPQGYKQNNYPIGTVVETYCWPWSPGYAVPLAGDALYPKGAAGQASFGIQPVYGLDAGGSPTIAMAIKGTSPFAALDKVVASPQVVVQDSSTGGTLAPGRYVIGVSAFDAGSADHANTDYLNLGFANVGGSGSGSIAVSITWGSGDDGGDLYIAQWNGDDEYIFHYNQTLTPGQATATVTTFDESTPGGPDPIFDHFGVTWMEEIHSGRWAEQIQVVTSTKITFASAGMTTNQWAGGILSLLAKNDLTLEVPIINVPIASSAASSGGLFTVTVGANAAGHTLPDLTTIFAVGDLVTMRIGAAFSASGFSDALMANPFYPSGATGVEAGHIAVMLTGADVGDMQTIASVTTDGGGHYTVFALAAPWAITPSTGAIVVICAPSSVPEWTSAQIYSKNSSLTGVVAQPRVDNLSKRTWLMRVRTKTAADVAGMDKYAPFRELYQVGAVGTPLTPSDGYYPNTPVGGHVLIDIANGLSQSILVTSDLIIDAPTSSAGLLVAGQYLRLKFVNDSAGGHALDWTTAGVWIDFTGQDIDPTGDYASNYESYLRPDGKWEYSGGARGTHT